MNRIINTLSALGYIGWGMVLVWFASRAMWRAAREDELRREQRLRKYRPGEWRRNG